MGEIHKTSDTRWKYMNDHELSKTADTREGGKITEDRPRGAQEVNRRKTQARGDQKH